MNKRGNTMNRFKTREKLKQELKFKENFKKIRELKGITKDELSIKSGLTRRSIDYYEHGDRLPDFNALVRLSEALEISIDTLVHGIKNK